MSKKKSYNYLFDVVSTPQKVEVLSEGRSEDNGQPKVIFKAKLQTADEKNQNGRVYSMPVCESITKQLRDKALNRSLLMEVDHPMVASNDPGLMKRRATTVEYKSCGCLLRNIYMEGTDIIGEIETLSSFLGPDVAKMVLYDKVNLGFSLRALGSVNTKPDGTIEVLTPIKPKVMGLK